MSGAWEKAGRHSFYHPQSLKPGLTSSLLPNPEGPGQVSVVQGSLCFSSGYISFKQEKGKPGKDFHGQEDGKL